MKQEQKIDAVVTWVNSEDKEWQKEREKYAPKKDDETQDNRDERFRDYGTLRYFLRGIEFGMPWINRLHFVHWGGELPDWLDTDNPKLNVVKHSDFIPEEYLPTFNSNAIEVHMHKIPGLTEQFVYFNDDFFLMKETKPEDWFREGKPVDMLSFCPILTDRRDINMSYLRMNNTAIWVKHFDKKEVCKRLRGKLLHFGYNPVIFGYNLAEMAIPRFSSLLTWHDPLPLLKSTFEKLWELEPEALQETSSHKFRNAGDTTIYAMREWEKLEGNFAPKNILKRAKFLYLSDIDEKEVRKIGNQKYMTVCVNDSYVNERYEEAVRMLITALRTAWPQKSSFEKYDENS